MDTAALTLALLRLPGVGAGRLARLRDAFGTLSAALAAAEAGAQAPSGIPGPLFAALPRRVDRAASERELQRVRGAGLEVLCWDDARYPAPLWLDGEAPPPLLYLEGALPPAFALSAARVPAAAVVGSRRPSGRGVQLARELGAALASLGVVVVSGLALGIDGAAHEGALQGGAPTVAVLGGGHRHLHPPSHRGLARRIVDANGVLVSAYPPDVRPERHAFPERNRLVSGLARLVVVVEAGLRSGTWSTVEHALRQQRDVFACPGRPGDPAVAGTLRLLRDGALPVTELEDVLMRFRADADTPGVPSAPPTAGASEALLRALFREQDASLDALATRLRGSVPAISVRLTTLELEGRVVRTSAGRYRLSALERERRSVGLDPDERAAGAGRPPTAPGAG